MNQESALIKDCATQYNVESILGRIAYLEELPEIKIGLLGEFSSGKTSLLNAVFGCKLPVSIKPTTRAVCLIEAKDDATTDTYALEDDAGERTPVDFLDFSDIIAGEKVGASVGVLQMPASEYFKQGMVFVDTPGVNSLNQAEADVTYRYLAFMDAALICLPIDKGTINQSTIDFITDRRLSHLTRHMYFVITKTDRKSNPNDIELVKNEVLNQLQALPTFANQSLEDRILTFSTKSEDQGAFRLFIEKHIIGNLPKLMRERKAIEMCTIAQDLITILKQKREIMQYDGATLEAQENALKDDIRKIKNLKSQKQEQFYQASENLKLKIKSLMDSYRAEITLGVAQEADTSQSFSMLAASINTIINTEVSALVSNFDTTGLTLTESTFTSLNRRLQNYHKTRSMITEITTAAIAALACPATGVVGNTAEAIGSTILQREAKNATKNLGKKGLLAFLGETIKEINPLEVIGTLVEPTFSEKAYDRECEIITANLSSRVIEQIESAYNNEVLAPLEAELEEKEKSIQRCKDERTAALGDFIAERDKLTKTIKTLEAAL